MSDNASPENGKAATTLKMTMGVKRHKLLNEISTQLRGMQISETIKLMGHEFYITTPVPDEEAWAETQADSSTVVTYFATRQVPHLAAAIKRIDGIPVDQLFEFPDDMSDEQKAYHNETPFRKRYWLMSQIATWLAGQSDVGDSAAPFINALWEPYKVLLEKRNKSWDEIKNSSARTPGGDSKATSSPVRESSPQTQM